MEHKNFRTAFWAIAVLALQGCSGSGPRLAEVTGKVTLDSSPVSRATVEFIPESAGGSPSLAVTDKDGNYRLAYSQDRFGALIGKHNVRITTKKISKDELPDDGSASNIAFVELPKKYGAIGTLTADVKSSSNSIDFSLQSK